MIPNVLDMPKNKVYFAIIFLMCFTQNFTNDIYSKFHQKDYKVDFQRMVMIDYKKSAFHFFEIKTFKYNRTWTAVNMTCKPKINLRNELEVVVQFYKFLSNEYRKLPGTSFQVNFCKSIKANLVGLQILFKCGNMTSCQLVQETAYEVCNVYPDESLFPPFFPNGEYKVVMDNIFNDEIIASVAMFIKIYRPIAVPKKR